MATINILLRKATLDDYSLLQHWDQQPHVIVAAPNDEIDWETELQRDVDWQEMCIAELEGRPLGFIQIIDPAREESHYWGEIEKNCRAIDIWIGEENDLGKGYGTNMMNLAIECCFADPKVHTIWIDPLKCNKEAIRFYERLRFKFVEKRRFGEDECAVYQLKREDWNNL